MQHPLRRHTNATALNHNILGGGVAVDHREDQPILQRGSIVYTRVHYAASSRTRLSALSSSRRPLPSCRTTIVMLASAPSPTGMATDPAFATTTDRTPTADLCHLRATEVSPQDDRCVTLRRQMCHPRATEPASGETRMGTLPVPPSRAAGLPPRAGGQRGADASAMMPLHTRTGHQ